MRASIHGLHATSRRAATPVRPMRSQSGLRRCTGSATGVASASSGLLSGISARHESSAAVRGGPRAGPTDGPPYDSDLHEARTGWLFLFPASQTACGTCSRHDSTRLLAPRTAHLEFEAVGHTIDRADAYTLCDAAVSLTHAGEANARTTRCQRRGSSDACGRLRMQRPALRRAARRQVARGERRGKGDRGDLFRLLD